MDKQLASADDLPCKYRGEIINKIKTGRSCQRRVEITYRCEVFGSCAIRRVPRVIGICLGCHRIEK